jgi:hypothetical protein
VPSHKRCRSGIRPHGLVFYGQESDSYSVYYLSRSERDSREVRLAMAMSFAQAAGMVHALNGMLFEHSEQDAQEFIMRAARQYLLDHEAEGCAPFSWLSQIEFI